MNSAIQMKKKADQNQTIYRYDLFKGSIGADGKVTKVRSVGSAYNREGQTTLTVTLKTFLEDKFFLLPNTKADNPANYVILTREIAHNIKRKYFWNSVGDGRILEGVNHGLMKLSWDVLSDDIYMSLHPMKGREAGQVDSDSAA